MKTPNEIKKGLENCANKSDCCWCPLMTQCEKEADALAYIQQLEAQVPKWISVEERLPEVDGKYIVCTAKQSVYSTRFRTYGQGGNFQTDINTHITHWMPLPELPKEDE